MNERRILNLIGLAYRARKVSLGVDMIMDDMQHGRVYFVLMAQDIQKNSKKQLINRCRSYDIPFSEIANRQLLGNAVGKEARVAIGILDKGFARSIQSLLQK